MKTNIYSPDGIFKSGYYEVIYSIDNSKKIYRFLGGVLYNFPSEVIKVVLNEQPKNSIIFKQNNYGHKN